MMKAKALAIAMDMVKESVGTDDLDVVEIENNFIKATNANWWTVVDIGEDLGHRMVLRYSVLRDILGSLSEESMVSLNRKNVSCVVKKEQTSAKEGELGYSPMLWKLNLMDVTLDKEPELDDSVEPVIGSGYDFLDAYKSLKHLMRPGLSRPGLMWGWANEQGELVVGDGARLGGRKCGVSGIMIPNTITAEIARILRLSMSETVRWQVYEKHMRVKTKNAVFTCVLPEGPQFEMEFYDVIRGKAQEPIILKLFSIRS